MFTGPLIIIFNEKNGESLSFIYLFAQHILKSKCIFVKENKLVLTIFILYKNGIQPLSFMTK